MNRGPHILSGSGEVSLWNLSRVHPPRQEIKGRPRPGTQTTQNLISPLPHAECGWLRAICCHWEKATEMAYIGHSINICQMNEWMDADRDEGMEGGMQGWMN